MTTYKQGQVVLIPFPFTDLTTTKQRPALIISSDRFNRTADDAIFLAITSHLPPKLSEFEFRLSETDQKSCGLPKASLVKLGKIASIDQILIRKVLGQIPTQTLSQIHSKFIKIVGH